jgi:hypothetical protein
MMINPAFLEAKRAVVRVYAPLQGGSMPRRELKEQARNGYAARALHRDKRNVYTGVALEAKALGGDGVEVPATIVAVTEALRKIARLSECYITAIEQGFGSYGATVKRAVALRLRISPWQPRLRLRSRRGSLGLGGALGAPGEGIMERIPTFAIGSIDWQWHGDWPPGKNSHAVGEAALVHVPPANEVGAGPRRR